ncbi:SEC-C metal-binding domain-containing protein [Fontivita pretiosa]|uniref:SEC-C metal-binding domain-containing protein n=1 Tax=Fontivita pretiosa TaxID=2989684 RepID=UPI003D178FAB
MLLPAKVIPFLQHADGHVRRLATRYLCRASDPTPATADDLWAAIDRFGQGERHEFYFALANLPQTHGSLQRTVAALHSDANADRRHALEQVLARLHYGLLLRFRDLIEGCQTLSPELRGHLQHRFELAQVPSARLWEMLMEAGHQPADRNRDDPLLSDRLIEALARSPESAGWAIALLSDPQVADRTTVYAVRLLGRMRHRPSVRLIADKLNSDQHVDGLIEAAIDALVNIGSAEAVQLIRQRHSACPPRLKLHAAELFGRIKLPQSESAAIELLAAENDPAVRTSLAAALCELAASEPRALNMLEQMVISRQWQPFLPNLQDDVTALFKMVGRPVPKWDALGPMPASASSTRPPFAATPTEASLSWDDEHDSELSPPPAAAAQAPAQPQTIRRDTPKVGRNDPCPCGSGKKYKRCCGR